MRRITFSYLLLLSSAACTAQSRSVPLEVPLVGSFNGDHVGRVIFRVTIQGALNIDVQVQSLASGEHAIHIHQYPICDVPDFKAAGSHFNPEGKQHGWNNPNGHHAGDFDENISVDRKGYGHLNVTTHELNLTPGSAQSVLGHSVVIHERGDDMTKDPSGKSGNRIACGVIPLSFRTPS